MSKTSPSPEEIFHQARQITLAVERDWYLKGACGSELALRSKVDALLLADADAGAFLSSGADAVSAEGTQEPLGSMIDRYKLLQVIGEGGFGVVYMAEQKEPVKRRVALKVIKLGMDTKQVIARFDAERQALAMMDHAHIAKVLDAGATNSGRPYFVMELVKGVSITDYCDQNNLTVQERLDLFRLVCSAVQHAHQKGIIHRDIKPSNVLVTLHDGVPVPKVIDFGIAKATSAELTEKTLFTEHGQMIGTPVYMSPEQAEMSGLDIDTRSDIYSLGVLLYELLTGTTPFTIEDLREAGYAEMQRMICEHEPQKPSTRISTLEALPEVAAHRRIEARKLGILIRGDLDWIIMKALEKDRTRRYETATAFAEDIGRHLAGDAVVAAPPSKPYRLRKFVRRNRGFVVATALVSAALLVGIAGLGLGLSRAKRAESDTNAAFAAELEARDTAEWAAYTANLALAQSAMEAGNWPEARRRIADCPENKRGWEWEFLSNKATSVIAQFSDMTSLSPDGGTILTVLDGRTVVLMDLEGKRLGDPFFEADDWRIQSAEWVADGKYVLIETGAPEVVRLYDLSGKLVAQPIECHSNHKLHLTTVSPDGRWVVTGDEHGTLYLWDGNGQATGIEYRHDSSVRQVLFTPDSATLVTLSDGIVRMWNLDGIVSGETRQQTVQFFGGSIAVSPNGRLVLVSIGGTAQLWDMLGNPVGALMQQPGSVSHAEFSPDGTVIMTPGLYGIQLRNLDGTPRGLFIHDAATQASGFSDDGSFVVTASDIFLTGSYLGSASMPADNSIRIWDLQGMPTGANFSSPLTFSSLTSNARARAILVKGGDWNMSRDNSYLVRLPLRTADRELGSNALTLLNLAFELGTGVDSLKRIVASPSQAALNLDPMATASTVLPDGSRIVTASGNTIRFWDPVTQRELAAMRMDIGVTNVTFSPDGTRLAVQKIGGWAQVFDIRSAEAQAAEVQRRWAERETAGEFLDTLMGGPTRNDDLLPTIEADATLPPIRRLVVAELLADRFVNINDAVDLMFDAITKDQTGKAIVLAAASDADLPVRAKDQLLARAEAWEYEPPTRSPADERTERISYSAFLLAAQAQLEAGNFADAQRLHNLCPELYRNWEWHHLELSLDQSLRTSEEHEFWVRSVSWSPDGTRIVSGANDNTPRIWDAATGEILLTLDGHQDSVYCAAWSPDGTLIVSGSDDKSLRIFDAESGENLLTLKAHEQVRSVAWSPDGTRIVAGARDGALSIWDAVTGERLHLMEEHRGVVNAVAWSPDGTLIVSGSMDATLRIWDAESGESLQTLQGAGKIKSVAWSPDGARIVSGSHTPSIWDVATGEILLPLDGHEGLVYSVAWSPDGTRIVSGSVDKTLRVWDAATGESVSTLRGHGGIVNSVAWNPDGTRIVSGSDDNSLRFWDVATGESVSTLEGHEEGLMSVAWSPDGTRIVSGSDDDSLRIWNAISGECLLTLNGHGKDVQAVAWSPDGTRIVSGSQDKTLRIWDAVTGKRLLILKGHENYVWSVAWSLDGTRIVSGAWDNTLRIWDATTGECLRTLDNGGIPHSVTWSPDGKRIASGSGNNTLRIWNAITGELLLMLEEHESWVHSVAWSPDGKRIVSGAGNTLRIWDPTSGERLQILEGHEGSVRAVAWSPDGTRIVSGSDDDTLRIWDPSNREALLMLEGHESWITSVAWSPDGKRIVTGSQDQTLRIWESRLEAALPMWRTEDSRLRVRPIVQSLFKEHILLEPVLSALREDHSLPDDQREVALRMARSRGNPTFATLHKDASSLVKSKHWNKDADLAFALRLARAAVELAPESIASMPNGTWEPATLMDPRNTLAWALFANGFYDEAVTESERALELVGEQYKLKYQRYLDRLRQRISEVRPADAPDEKANSLNR